MEIGNKRYICSLDYAMEIIKGKWKAVIICHLNDSSSRFLELQRRLSGVSQKVLTEKLNQMIEDRIIEKVVYPEMPPRVEYKLTEQGKKLFKILNTLQIWADEYIEEINGIN